MWSREELARDFRALGVSSRGRRHAPRVGAERWRGCRRPGSDPSRVARRAWRRRHADDVCRLSELLRRRRTRSAHAGTGKRGSREAPAIRCPHDAIGAAHGVLVEFFRTFPGTVVNNHIARFAAAGAHADRLMAAHPWNLPYGTGSPLDRFRALGGKILLLGSDHDEVTFLHHVEHTVEFAGQENLTLQGAVRR